MTYTGIVSSSPSYYAPTTGIGGSTEAGVYASSLGEVLDLYAVHFGFTAIFVAGALMLMIRYGQNQTGSFVGVQDFFFAAGGITVLLNIGFLLATVIAWASKKELLSRNDPSVHWLHGISILSAALVFIWGITALVITFADVLTTSMPDSAETAGYFMVFLCVLYAAYITVRAITGLAGKPKASDEAAKRLASTYTFDQVRSAAARVQPITSAPRNFGAGFSGLDTTGLGGLMQSSITTTRAQQPPQAVPGYPAPSAGAPGGATYIFAGGGFAGGTPVCTPDPNAITLT